MFDTGIPYTVWSVGFHYHLLLLLVSSQVHKTHNDLWYKSIYSLLLIRWSKYPISEKKEVLSQPKEQHEEAKYEYEMSSVSIAFRGLDEESKTLGFRQGEEETST